MARMPRRALVIRPLLRKHPKARANKRRQLPPALHLREPKAAQRRRSFSQASTHVLPATGFSPLRNAHGGYCEPPGMPEAVNAACEHGMVGTPPNCHCPKNSELLGGNCVHYTETCRIGLAADFTPQPCAGAEEKLACKTRQDGLKDCCCLTYDKL